MPQPNHRKRALLFLAAVLLPSAVLVGTTARLIRQERELAIRRTGEERALLALRVGQDLLEDLRSLETRVTSAAPGPQGMFALMASEPALVTLAVVDNGQLVFPWEMYPEASSALDRTNLARYTRFLKRGEDAEYQQGDPVAAAGLYGRAAAVLEERIQRDESTGGGEEPMRAAAVLLGEARVHEARALLRAGRTAEAEAVFLQLAESPPSLTDREGMPFTVYGLEGLHQTGADRSELVRLLRTTLDGSVHFCLPALLALKELTGGISKGGEGSSIGADLRAVEDALTRQESLQEDLEQLRIDFPALLATVVRGTGSRDPGKGPLWLPYGGTPWLVGVLNDRGEGATRVPVVQPAQLLLPGNEVGAGVARDEVARDSEDEVKVAARRVTLLPAGVTDGESLGQALNGLRGSFPPGFPHRPERGGVEGWFFRLLLPVILILTGFTAYLAWRDVRREVEAVRLRSQFVSSVTHELKTPLTAIRMFAETLRLGRHTGPETQREYLDTVVHETERLSRLINNVLDFARIDRGEKTYHKAATDVGAAAREAARALAYPLSRDGYTLTTEIDDDLPLVEADADALTQALLNLLSNAIKFSRVGSEIGLRAFREGEHVLLQVEDQGRGIAPQDQEAIFRDFFRTRDAEREGIPGTGLGLALVAHVAEAHGGRVDVDSELGRGSTFTIRLPIEGRSIAMEERRAPIPAGSTPDPPAGGAP